MACPSSDIPRSSSFFAFIHAHARGLLRRGIKITSTFFYVGYLPFIPGTFGSIAGLILVTWLQRNPTHYFVCALSIISIGFLVASEAEKIFQKKDARCIVIDEVSGILVSFAFLTLDLRLAIIGFFIFRLLDTLKVPPAGRLQERGNGIGIMADDIVAGIYTNVILQLVARLTSFTAS